MSCFESADHLSECVYQLYKVHGIVTPLLSGFGAFTFAVLWRFFKEDRKKYATDIEQKDLQIATVRKELDAEIKRREVLQSDRESEIIRRVDAAIKSKNDSIADLKEKLEAVDKLSAELLTAKDKEIGELQAELDAQHEYNQYIEYGTALKKAVRSMAHKRLEKAPNITKVVEQSARGGLSIPRNEELLALFDLSRFSLNYLAIGGGGLYWTGGSHLGWDEFVVAKIDWTATEIIIGELPPITVGAGLSTDELGTMLDNLCDALKPFHEAED
jgi:hypothetical protein